MPIRSAALRIPDPLRSVSRMSAMTFSPPMPSTTEWCTLTISAAAPSAMPSTSTASHRGRARSNGRPAIDWARSSTPRRSPGSGARTCARWVATSKSGTSCQRGRPQGRFGGTTTERKWCR